jgi:phage major head subunit gpT-like protein
MDINHAALTVFFRDLETNFTKGFNSGIENSVFSNVAMSMPSVTEAAVHAWLNQIPNMREWVGDRTVNDIESDTLTITNAKYESTIEMKREEIEDDVHGVYLPIAESMGITAAQYPDELLVSAMVAGETDTWADGSTFFNNSRTFGSNTIDNLVELALSSTTFNTAITNMSGYKGHSDKPLKVVPKYLVYGPSNRTTAFDILKNDFIAGSSTLRNPNQNLVTGIESSRLVGDDATKWFLCGEIAGIRGPVWQDRTKPEFQRSRLNIDSDYVFENDKFQFGTRMRGKAFLSLPQLIVGGFPA